MEGCFFFLLGAVLVVLALLFFFCVLLPFCILIVLSLATVGFLAAIPLSLYAYLQVCWYHHQERQRFF